MTHHNLLRRCAELAESGAPFVLVTLVEAVGSTPSDSGAKMVVTGDGLAEGTIGGGRVEAQAIAHSQAMLAGRGDSRPACEMVDWNLKADVGMTCGGRVRLLFEPFGIGDWRVVVFGAGHVSQALCKILVTLPCRVTCVDPRRDWLDRLPQGVEAVRISEPADYVERLPREAYLLCMTKGHSSDLPVLKQIYTGETSFAFVGVIGSRAKAAVLRKELAAAGIGREDPPFVCPVGLPIGTNHPGEIAVSIAAQLIEARDKARA